ncbi:MAG: hypothetical protein GEV08_01480 [Acidimicrobiia bacterium]|nr:hypothetical protein [Acidimicrobiia bacterium]
MTAVVVDLGYPPAWATLAVSHDGQATLAASTGGTATGASSHVGRLLEAAAATLHLVPPAEAFPLPPVGSVAFHVLTVDGGRTRTVAEAELRSLDHPLTLLFSAVQAVLADLRPS